MSPAFAEPEVKHIRAHTIEEIDAVIAKVETVAICMGGCLFYVPTREVKNTLAIFGRKSYFRMTATVYADHSNTAYLSASCLACGDATGSGGV